ncbi:hypothetical protein ACQR10_19555 [Bradyrhizobium sp. HKCCYLRH2060]|uniref:hypothetical protein n=1 Tax=Bradyrhizobium sp. HKCCYLRH2060 TaxID=3420743 RepID=UPI003EC04FC4
MISEKMKEEYFVKSKFRFSGSPGRAPRSRVGRLRASSKAMWPYRAGGTAGGIKLF